MAGAAVYLWHCDRRGRYSMYSSGDRGRELPPRHRGDRQRRHRVVQDDLPGVLLGALAAHPLRGLLVRRQGRLERPDRQDIAARAAARRSAIGCTRRAVTQAASSNLARTSLSTRHGLRRRQGGPPARDRSGRYSRYDPAIEDENYLRGIAATDSDGTAWFRTIFPACYSGRWPHIHFEVYESISEAVANGPIVKTSQIALPKAAVRPGLRVERLLRQREQPRAHLAVARHGLRRRQGGPSARDGDRQREGGLHGRPHRGRLTP